MILSNLLLQLNLFVTDHQILLYYRILSQFTNEIHITVITIMVLIRMCHYYAY